MKPLMAQVKRAALHAGLGVLAMIAASCGSSPPDDILERSGQAAIVFVRENSRQNNNSSAMRSNEDEFYPGSDLFLLSPISPQGKITNLTAQYTQAGISEPRNYGAVADPEVSFDGKKILFSMRVNRNGNSRWCLYEMNADGSGLVQLTDPRGADDMDPTYLPNGQIIFTSTRPGIADEYEGRTSPLLHVGDRGAGGQLTNIRRVSFNQSHDVNPMVHSSGKVIYSRWEHLGNPNKFPLFVMNPDGTRPFVMYGNHSPRENESRVFLEARELSDGGLVCSIMERNSPFEGGAIAILDISSSDDNITFITPPDVKFSNAGEATSAFYKTPHPIIDKSSSADREEKILVAMSPIPSGGNNNGGVDYGIYVMEKDGSNLRLIYNDPNYNEIDPIPVLPREKIPGGVPQVLGTDPNVAAAMASGARTGMFFDGNVYDRARNDGQVRPSPTFVNADGTVGQAKYLRVIEAVAMPRDGNRRGQTVGNTNFEKQRVIGYASIRPDGSFSVEVPANRSLHMQTLDQHGLMLVNQLTWVQVMPGERRLCTGCHDSHDRDRIINDLQIQPNSQVLNRASGAPYQSGFHNAELVTAHPSARTDTVDFFDRYRTTRTNTVQNILDRRCISCHSGAEAAGGLNLATVPGDLTPPPNPFTNMTTSVYDRLVNRQYRTASGSSLRLVHDHNGARQSPLIWIMFGRQMDDPSNRSYRTLTHDHSQLWERDSNGRIDPFRPANRDLLTMIEWVDLGTQFSNTVGQ